VEDLLAEEVEAGAAVAAALEELEAVDVPFRGSVAVRVRQGVVDRVAVGVEVGDEAPEGVVGSGADGVAPGGPGVGVAEVVEAGSGECNATP
jgi:hypothetical protein